MCRAMGSSGSSAQPLLEDLHRLVDLAERAVRERQQPAAPPDASACSVITFEKQSAASCDRFWPFSRTPRLLYASECSGSMRMAARYAASASTSSPFARSTTPRLLCALA